MKITNLKVRKLHLNGRWVYRTEFDLNDELYLAHHLLSIGHERTMDYFRDRFAHLLNVYDLIAIEKAHLAAH